MRITLVAVKYFGASYFTSLSYFQKNKNGKSTTTATTTSNTGTGTGTGTSIPNATVNELQICSLVLSIYSTFALAVFELS